MANLKFVADICPNVDWMLCCFLLNTILKYFTSQKGSELSHDFEVNLVKIFIFSISNDDLNEHFPYVGKCMYEVKFHSTLKLKMLISLLGKYRESYYVNIHSLSSILEHHP